ncbi:DnaA regulatory inactivator Hda [Thiohalomonas denitrificans]|uniref:Regulatory inactivation of DnaA Hda protein n=1 Tax=Thiohalomonas denitrificans TaxID=415747 RepID=A0A1G5QMH3_9GAMM|nr:DnaA regulatory inactivator Hda [Thiohalomonas denitrificans]SCZ62846.1 regulatory inactivation of DnaA Hda protein [Thiohalomonas denitrificans]
MSAQLPLGVGLRDGATFDNFFAGPNTEVVLQLERGNEPFLFLWGGAGSGRSHLLQAACHRVSGESGGAVYLPLSKSTELAPEMLEGLETMALVTVDDLQQVAGHTGWEVGLFHLYNRARESGCRIVVAADAPPGPLGISLPDLRSRLSWGPVYQLLPLVDADKRVALQLRAHHRGMELSDEVANYILRRSPRDLHSLFSVLEHLDRASLAAQRRLTVPFVREQLAIMP